MTAYAAVILAAGQASRFRAAGGAEDSKVLALVNGEALVRHVARTALASRTRPVIVVTGHAREAVEAALHGLPLVCVHNPAFPEGMATSLKLGLRAVPTSCAGAVVLLADMPSVDRSVVDALVERAVAVPLADAVVPVHDGRRGNPVLLSRSMFPQIETLTGDLGARTVFHDSSFAIEEVETPQASVFHDIDEPEDLARLRDRDQTRAVDPS